METAVVQQTAALNPNDPDDPNFPPSLCVSAGCGNKLGLQGQPLGLCE